MNKKISNIAILAMMFFTIVGLGAQNDTLILKKITTLDGQVSNLTDSLSHYKAIIKDYESIDKSAKLANEFLSNPIGSLFKYGAFLLALSLIGIWGIFWMLNKLESKWFTTIIQRWVERYEAVNKLKEKKRILVLSSEDFPNEVFIKKMFDKKHFKEENIKYVSSIKTAKTTLEQGNYAVLFANNEDDCFNQADLEDLISNHKYSVLFYYGKSGSWDFRKYKDKEPDYLKRLNLANSRAQVYGNLISSMNYHDVLM